MFRRPQVSPLNVVLCLTDVIDLVSTRLQKHHKQVGYCAWRLARQMDMSPCETARTVIAGLTHDCGAFSLHERERLADFEAEFRTDDAHSHARRGATLLERVNWFAPVGNIVRWHHRHWSDGTQGVPLGSQVLHLSDRVSVSASPEKCIMAQAPDIRDRIQRYSGDMFNPDVVEAFMEVSETEAFWFDLDSDRLRRVLSDAPCRRTADLDREGMSQLIRLFAYIIDFRSRFTATHSAGVAAGAKAIAGHLGFNDTERRQMEAAGHLHDLGKLAVPAETLEHDGELNARQRANMKKHPYFGYRSLEQLPQLEMVSEWAFLHHERVDGSGYPFGLTRDELPLGARIMAVADVFGALNEDRPYRDRMPADRALDILRDEAAGGGLDGRVVDVLEENLDDVMTQMEQARERSREHYEEMTATMEASSVPAQ